MHISFRNFGINKGKFLIKNVNFELNESEVICILGRSGSGKSTLSKLILGDESINKKHITGSLIIDGVDCTHQSTYGRRFCLVSEEYGLFEGLSIMENLSAVVADELTKSEVDEVLNTLRIKHLVQRKINEISLGQKQRVLIARAIISNPRLIIIDEALSGLDSITKWQTLKLIKQVMKTKRTAFIIISHQVSDAFFLGGKVLILESGKQANYGDIHYVHHNPACEPTSKLTGVSCKIHLKFYKDYAELDHKKLKLNKEVPSKIELGKTYAVIMRPSHITRIKLDKKNSQDSILVDHKGVHCKFLARVGFCKSHGDFYLVGAYSKHKTTKVLFYSKNPIGMSKVFLHAYIDFNKFKNAA